MAEYDAITEAILRQGGYYHEKSEVVDENQHCIIDKISKSITGPTFNIVQLDHDSERITYEIPKIIDGHDMLKCTSVEIHYLAGTNSGIYEVDDLQIKDENTLTFTWLISQNVTKELGTINYVVRFVCADENELYYVWQTKITTNIIIVQSIFNSNIVINQNVDILEQWRKKLELSIDETLTVSGEAADAKAVGDNFKIMSDYIQEDVIVAIDNNASEIVSLKESVETLENKPTVSSWNELTNKPFYTFNEFVPVFENVSMRSTFMSITGLEFYGYKYSITETMFNSLAVEGKTCKISVDTIAGETCKCKLVQDSGLGNLKGLVYGNTDYLLGIGTSGETFVVVPGWETINEEKSYFLLMIFIFDTTRTEHVWSLYSLEKGAKKLDAIYHDDDHIRSIVDEVINEALAGDY